MIHNTQALSAALASAANTAADADRTTVLELELVARGVRHTQEMEAAQAQITEQRKKMAEYQARLKEQVCVRPESRAKCESACVLVCACRCL